MEGSSWLWGLVGALIHYALAGPVVKPIPSIDPGTGEVGRQDLPYTNDGALDVATSFLGHTAEALGMTLSVLAHAAGSPLSASVDLSVLLAAPSPAAPGVDVLAAVVAGLVAGPLMEVPAYLQRLLGKPLHQDVFAESGRLLLVDGTGQRLVGYLGHAALSAVIGVLYAVFFNAAGVVEALAVWGVLGGFVHFVIGGLVIDSAFPVLEPEALTRGARRLGFAYAHYGVRDVVTFLGGHLTFGALVGVLYPLLHPLLTASAWF